MIGLLGAGALGAASAWSEGDGAIAAPLQTAASTGGLTFPKGATIRTVMKDVSPNDGSMPLGSATCDHCPLP